MLLVQAFRAHLSEPVSIHLVNVDMTLGQRFVELCLDGVIKYSLPYNKKIPFPQVKRRSPKNRVAYCAIENTGLLVISQILF